jgi:hypothetical protein
VHALREKADNFVKKVHEQKGDFRVQVQGNLPTGQLANPPVGEMANLHVL